MDNDADLDAYPVPYEDLVMGLTSLDVADLHVLDEAAMRELSGTAFGG